MTRPQAAFHVHYDRLWEWLTELIENRIADIKANKPETEWAIRLRLLQMIPPDRIANLIAAREQFEVDRRSLLVQLDLEMASNPAWDVRSLLDQYEVARSFAWEQYKAAEKATDMAALHQELCPDCPWDGKTIFPKGGNDAA